jgi:hypothetical protein
VDGVSNVDHRRSPHLGDRGRAGTTILTGPARRPRAQEATFVLLDQANAVFECSLDLAQYTSCTSPATFTDVPYGAHELLVRARSPLGTMIDLTPAEYTWESGDMTPPVVTILTGPAATTTDTTASFTFSVDDPAALLQCSLDGSPLAFCTSPIEYTGLAADAHTF